MVVLVRSLTGLFATVLAVAALQAVAHPEGDDVNQLSPEVVLRRRASQLARRDAAAQCAASLARRDDGGSSGRWERLYKRAIAAGADPATFSLSRRATSCTADPEITAGPYYINGFIRRDNIMEDQAGFPLLLEISFMDIATCSALEGAAIEFWNCNATGTYSGFDGATACLHGSGSGSSSCMTSQETFLRGWVYTDSNGVAEMTTVYPGFYEGRAPHIHMAIHTGGSEADNGTYVGGGYRHFAQLFPGDTVSLAVYQVVTGPYYSYYEANKDTYVSTDDDSVRTGADYENYGNLDLTPISSSDLSKGYVGTVAVYVDTSATYSDPSTNYYDSSVSFISAATSISGVDLTSLTGTGGSATATGSTSATSKSSTSGATKRIFDLRFGLLSSLAMAFFALVFKA
ncbi:hypothetical protein HK405_006576 [Cladochytrium tenue]|nr:hypothetical protein HK405_006576 [Cladochytrium tenue]